MPLTLAESIEAAAGNVSTNVFPGTQSVPKLPWQFSLACSTLRCLMSEAAAVTTSVAAALSPLLLSFVDIDQPRSTSKMHTLGLPLRASVE